MRNQTKVKASNEEAIVLNPGEAIDMIVGLYNAGAFKRTPLFRGAPGIGKTASIEGAVAELRKTIPDFQYIEVNPTMPADEVAGIPDLVRTDGEPTRTDYAMPTWFPRDPNWKGIICLDDGLQGDKMMQQTLANLIHARNLRGHKLPEGAMIVVTGNRDVDNAGVGRMLSHLADRMTFFDVEADPKSWINEFALPNKVDERIISYIEQHPDKLNQFDPKAHKCPTSRTWAALSTRMAYIDSLNTAKTQGKYNKFGMAIFAGELGMGEAIKFWAFCSMWGKLPNIDEILANPMEAAVVESVDLQYAVAAAVAKKMTSDTFKNGLTYVERLNPDLSAMVVKLGTRDKPELKTHEVFETWAVENAELIHGWLTPR